MDRNSQFFAIFTFQFQVIICSQNCDFDLLVFLDEYYYYYNSQFCPKTRLAYSVYAHHFCFGYFFIA
ncbi:hypothetical protein B5M19_00725 [Mesomycoplasma hyopneumoniae]|uniref:Uncharacterized protein n=2 Tax=Mesomycoplasma hyopneumoniae (strain 168) TaxID=907287 RepID=E4QT20_MESH1|nr:Putative uncharacterized protein [Mesomycoplasma hyopneumoniae 168]AGM22146.1 hypothetical protein MHP168L_368 [Mesomycoplasma hyopneumoniae 168-L]OWG13957.1 hypothetical protein B5C39_03375 [Mesomycoplasma hyopneumoniae]OWY74154.1 hypothetical protein B5M19_00725 [Mesomycoplasma hyopneumoniae]